ncbi:hypothetical protein T4B_14537 [Trichinella pseudospiralis]|uniref:Uncharacterized protein n=1 Tax=Trichinella pseudospiralis TaxID=6337 RepID=A0A0V1F2M3_TRIPS|nr:hypothetical protein T4B_14537 [Trichinella pseudospiralis]
MAFYKGLSEKKQLVKYIHILCRSALLFVIF